ncbi:MAG: sugar transferase [Ignavibacteria bacterium]
MNKEHKITSNVLINNSYSENFAFKNEFNMSKIILPFIANLIIYLFSYFIFYYLQRGTLLINARYLDFLFIYLASWFISTLVSRKFQRINNHNYWSLLKSCISSFFVMLGILTVTSYLFEIIELSRKIILGSLLLAFLIELIYLRLRSRNKTTERKTVNISFNLTRFIREFVILSSALFAVYLMKFSKVELSETHFLLLVGVYLCWLFSSIFSNLFFQNKVKRNFISSFWPYMKTYIVLAILVFFIVFLLRTNFTEQLNYLFGIGVYSLSSLFIFSFMYIARAPSKSDEVKLKILRATKYEEIRTLEKSFSNGSSYKYKEGIAKYPILREQLQKVYLKKFPEVYDFISKNINLESIEILNSVMLRSADPYNVEVLPENTIQFYLNLHEINDMRRLNAYLIQINKRLVKGGIYISRIEPVKFRYKRFLDTYPYYLAQLFYFIDFLWRRVCPKLPIIQKFYFATTKGHNRAISLAEGLGRLYYCGFEVIDIKEIDNFVYFITKKVKEPSSDSNPSYGPFFKMRRIGKGGNRFFVYKFRTMHPYAEYLQQFIYEKFSLKEGGKFNDDFRISSWGKIFRKLWIDEFPMFINLFKGQLKLVGVRPLSNHYLNLYPDELKKKRFKTKPGLVPPYYADLPKSLEEIILSEEKYLDKYFENPFSTDVKYFFKVFYNIIFKEARSS